MSIVDEQLARAVHVGDLERIEKELAAGADPNGRVWIYPDAWNTPTGLAVTSMRKDVLLRLMAAGGDLGVMQPRGLPILQLCNSFGSDDFAAWLADRPEHRSLVGRINIGKLLAEVAGRARPKLVKVLLDDHYRPYSDAAERGLALVHAARIRCVESVRLLLAHGASLDAREESRQDTALHWASQRGDLIIARLLIEAGVGLDVRQCAGFAPLHLACEHDSVGVAELLLDSGAHPTPKNTYGETPFDCAIEQDAPRLASLLVERGHAQPLVGEELDKAFVKAVSKGRNGTLRLLAEWGADLHQCPGGRTLLQIAPSQAHETKRLLRALRTEGLLEQAMGEGPDGPGVRAGSGLSPI